jgi:hypothetical protein
MNYTLLLAVVLVSHTPSLHLPPTSHTPHSTLQMQTPTPHSHHLQLPPRQIRHHLPSRNPRHPPQRREIQSAGQPIRKPEAHHGRDPTSRVLESKARALHLVLLDLAATQMMHAALVVDFWYVGPWSVGELRAGDDVEVVVGGVPACVAFCADCCA